MACSSGAMWLRSLHVSHAASASVIAALTDLSARTVCANWGKKMQTGNNEKSEGSIPVHQLAVVSKWASVGNVVCSASVLTWLSCRRGRGEGGRRRKQERRESEGMEEDRLCRHQCPFSPRFPARSPCCCCCVAVGSVCVAAPRRGGESTVTRGGANEHNRNKQCKQDKAITHQSSMQSLQFVYDFCKLGLLRLGKSMHRS